MGSSLDVFQERTRCKRARAHRYEGWPKSAGSLQKAKWDQHRKALATGSKRVLRWHLGKGFKWKWAVPLETSRSHSTQGHTPRRELQVSTTGRRMLGWQGNHSRPEAFLGSPLLRTRPNSSPHLLSPCVAESQPHTMSNVHSVPVISKTKSSRSLAPHIKGDKHARLSFCTGQNHCLL